MSDRQRNIYYRNVYHCYQFVLASIYINIYFVLASIYSSMFWDFSSISWFWRSNKTQLFTRPKYRYTGITGIFFSVYRYRNFLIPNIPISYVTSIIEIVKMSRLFLPSHGCLSLFELIYMYRSTSRSKHPWKMWSIFNTCSTSVPQNRCVFVISTISVYTKIPVYWKILIFWCNWKRSRTYQTSIY